MEFNLRQLRTFLSIARLGSFAAAAHHLHATQPTITIRIQELEEALGVKLFVRARSGVRLTPKGRALLSFAEQMLALASQTQREVGELSDMAGTVRLGACEPIALTWLPSFLMLVRERFPRVNLEVDNDLTTGLNTKLKRGEIDLALVAGPVPDPRVTALHVGSVAFCWVTGKALDVPEGTLGPREMRSLPLISLSQQPYEYPAIERWLQGAFDHRYVITCNDMSVVLRLVTAGAGVSLLADACCRPLIKRGELRVLRTNPQVPPVDFFAVWRRAPVQPFAPAIAALAAEASSFSLKAGSRKK